MKPFILFIGLYLTLLTSITSCHSQTPVRWTNQQAYEPHDQQKREEQLIKIEPTECKFDVYDSWEGPKIRFTFKANLLNVSTHTFIDASFGKTVTTELNWFFNEYDKVTHNTNLNVLLHFNKQYSMSPNNSYSVFDLSYDDPWPSNTSKTIGFNCYCDELTSGYARFSPTSCVLQMGLELEDTNGQKYSKMFKYDLMNIWEEFTIAYATAIKEKEQQEKEKQRIALLQRRADSIQQRRTDSIQLVQDSIRKVNQENLRKPFNMLSSASLAGRSLQGALPRPEYGAREEGRVVIEITVDRRGRVTDATYRSVGSTTQNSTLINAALRAARQARFNEDENAPISQRGTIAYNFRMQ